MTICVGHSRVLWRAGEHHAGPERAVVHGCAPDRASQHLFQHLACEGCESCGETAHSVTVVSCPLRARVFWAVDGVLYFFFIPRSCTLSRSFSTLGCTYISWSTLSLSLTSHTRSTPHVSGRQLDTRDPTRPKHESLGSSKFGVESVTVTAQQSDGRVAATWTSWSQKDNTTS